METIENEKSRRISLTKSQRQTEIGIELISLCQSFTEDGSLSDEETRDLRRWLDENRSSDLPAISFLVETVQKVLADGTITKDERRSVYKALEVVLPPDLRKGAVARRRTVENKEKSQERVLREQEREREREERERNRPLGSWNFMVAGVRYENRAAIISRHVREDGTAYLKRDSGNRFSRNAVEVRAENGMMVGYVPEDDAVEIAPLLDKGCRHEAFFTKVLTAGRAPIPVVQAYLYREDSIIEGRVSQSDIPVTAVPSFSSLPALSWASSIPWKYVLIALIALLILYRLF